MCNEKLWADVVPYLDDSLELVYLPIPKDKNFDALAKHYKSVLGNEPVNLIGFSLGGYIAAYYAALYPESVDKLFIISNSPTQLPDEEIKQRNDILSFVKTHGYKGMSRKKVLSMLDNTNHTERFVKQVLEMDKALGESEFISQYSNTSDRADLSSAIKRFSCETHLYYSET